MTDVLLLRARIALAPKNRIGYRLYDRELRRDLKEYTTSRLEQGAGYKQISDDLGMASATLQTWCKHSSPKQEERGQRMGFRPVEIKDERSDSSGSESRENGRIKTVSRPSVVLVSGVRIEGISLAELPDFLKRLE